MRFTKMIFLSGFAFFALSMSSCRDTERQPEMNGVQSGREAEVIEEDLNELRDENGDVITTVKADPELRTFGSRLDAAEVSDTIQQDTTYTIFAPNETAYALVEDEQGKDKLHVDYSDVIYYHIAPGEFTEEMLRREIELAGGTYNITTLQGEDLKATLEEGSIKLEGATGTTARITETMRASNGIVHMIDMVLMPLDIDTSVELVVEE